MEWRKAVRAAAVSSLALAGFWLSAPSLMAQDEAETETATEKTEPQVMDTVKEEAAKVQEKAQEFNTKARGLLGDFRVGPSVAIGIPHPLTASLDVVYDDMVNLSFGAGRFGTKVKETEVEIRNWDVTARWFVFQGSFYLGAAYGSQGLVGKHTTTVDLDYNGVALKVPTTLRLEVESKYLTPQLGWFARWDSGFTMGFEIGYIMPSGATSELQTSFKDVSASAEAAVRASEDYKKSKKDVEDLGEQLGKKGIPYITLLRLGWLL